MFLKIGVLKNYATFTGKTCAGPCWTFFTEHLRWLVLDFRGRKHYFSAEYGIYCWQSHGLFCSELLWKRELNLKNSHWNSPVKIGVLKNVANFTGKQLCWSIFLIELQAVLLKRDSNTDVFLWNSQNFQEHNLRSANDCFWNLFFHLDCPHFWLKLIHML